MDLKPAATGWPFFSMTLGLVLLGAASGAMAQAPGYQILSPSGAEIVLSGINQPRKADSLILYTPEYGPATQTNMYGVEILGTPSGVPNEYVVQTKTSIYDCQKPQAPQVCGNMAMPQGAVVLSAAGNRRPDLLNNFAPGNRFVAKPILNRQSQMALAATNPTPQTNPTGSGFPGARGGNQLVIYTPEYGQPTTGTNEFGFEVTVVDGRVVEQQGANSTLPSTPGSFILSGHGGARKWILEHATLGSQIELKDGQVISRVDKQTWLFQLNRLKQKIDALPGGKLPSELAQQLQDLNVMQVTLSDEAVYDKAMALQKQLETALWKTYPSFSNGAIKAVWHRPSEDSLASVRATLDGLKQAGVNTLFLETYLHGDPIFPSRTFGAWKIPQKQPFILKDRPYANLLSVWLDEAHKRNLKVHVWFQTFYAGNAQLDKAMGPILQSYPQWANIQRSALGKATLPPSTLEPGGYFLDPVNQEAQNFVIDLIDEILTDYPIDGFQLDYIRYPSSFPEDRFSYKATTWGYTPVARDIFKSRFGLDPVDLSPDSTPSEWAQWNDFKTRQVDRFVRKIHDDIKMMRPELPLSVAVFPKPDESLARKHQNWVAWAQEGLVDFIAPMTLTSSLETIAQDTQTVSRLTKLPVITGIFGPFNGSGATDVVDQVWRAKQAGAAGVSLFDTAHLTPAIKSALPLGVFKPATVPLKKP